MREDMFKIFIIRIVRFVQIEDTIFKILYQHD